MYLPKINFVQITFVWRNCNGFTIATMHSFRLNWTFQSFDTCSLIENKLACNLGTWNTSLIQIWMILSSKFCFHDNESYFDNFANVIITQMHVAWSDHLICVKCSPIWNRVFGGSQIRVFHFALQMRNPHGPLHSLFFLAIFFFFVAKIRNVARFAIT